jgi:hypothetical protein
MRLNSSPIALALLSLLPATYGKALESAPHHLTTRANHVFTPELSATIDAMRRNVSIPGYSIAFVQLDSTGEKKVEFASWGNMTEDGEPMTEDVGFSIAILLSIYD